MFDALAKTWLLVGAVVFVIVVFSIAYTVSKNLKSSDDFNVAGRNIPTLALILTLTGTHMGGSAMLGYMQHGYVGGIGRIFEVIPMMIVMYLMTIFLIKPIKNIGDKFKMVTLPDFTALRFGELARLPSVISLLCAYSAITGVQFVAVGNFLRMIFGINLTFAIILGCIFLTIYTYIGGLKAVVWTDFFNGGLQNLGMILIFIWIYLISGGYSPLEEMARNMGKPDLANLFSISRKELFVYTLTIAAYQVVRQDVWQRIWAAKNTRAASNSNWIAVTMFLILSVMIFSVGAFARVNLGMEVENSAMIFYEVVKAYMPTPLFIFMIITLMGTIVSCGDSFLVSGGSTIANDIIKPLLKVQDDKKMFAYSRYSIIIMSLVGLFGALYIQDLIKLWVTGTAMLVSGLVIPTLCGFFWKKATNMGGVISMWGGLLVAIVWQFMGHPFGWHPVFVGLPVSIVLIVVVSLLTKPSDLAIVEATHFSNNRAVID